MGMKKKCSDDFFLIAGRREATLRPLAAPSIDRRG